MGRRRYRPKSFSESDKAAFLTALDEGRNQLLKFEQEFALEKTLHSACEALSSAIDDTAEVLTGDRTYFHAKHFGSPVSPIRDNWSDEHCQEVAQALGLDADAVRDIGCETAPATSPFVRPLEYPDSMPGKWCTVSVVGAAGKRFSIDVLATSTYDAAHLYVTHAKTQPAAELPSPTTSTLFEVVIDGKVHIVKGIALAEWIQRRRREWNGPRGFLFSQRPTL